MKSAPPDANINPSSSYIIRTKIGHRHKYDIDGRQTSNYPHVQSTGNGSPKTIDTKRAGGRLKLARYEQRRHHHKVSYNDDDEATLQYKAEKADIRDDVFLHEAGLSAVVRAHMSDENIEQLRDVCGMSNNTNQIAHKANAASIVTIRDKAEQLLNNLTELIRRILRGGDLSEPMKATGTSGNVQQRRQQ